MELKSIDESERFFQTFQVLVKVDDTEIEIDFWMIPFSLGFTTVYGILNIHLNMCRNFYNSIKCKSHSVELSEDKKCSRVGNIIRML